MRTSRTGIALVAAGLALLAAACGSPPTGTTAASSPNARPSTSATTLAPSPVCNTEMKLTQPANGTRFIGSNGTPIVLKVCGTAASTRYMPIDVDPGGSVTLDYDANTAMGPQLLSPAGGTVVFIDQGVGNLGSVEHMQVGYQPVSTTQCATYIQNISGPNGDYNTTLGALHRHGCVTPVLAHVVAVNK
jgi:hypothetical protein